MEQKILTDDNYDSALRIEYVEPNTINENNKDKITTLELVENKEQQMNEKKSAINEEIFATPSNFEASKEKSEIENTGNDKIIVNKKSPYKITFDNATCALPMSNLNKFQSALEQKVSNTQLLLDTEESLQPQLERRQSYSPTIRSNTPLAREFSALKKSVHESKVLTEFFTDTDRKSRKLDGTASPDGSHYTAKITLTDQMRHRQRKFVALKADGDDLNFEEMRRRRRSRSQCSMRKHRNTNSDNVHFKLKRYPSEEKFQEIDDKSQRDPAQKRAQNDSSMEEPLCKHKKYTFEDEPLVRRKNMRSNNPDFVQRQADFLSCLRDKDDSDFLSENGISSTYMDDTSRDSKTPTNSNCSNNKINDSENTEDTLEGRLKLRWQPPPKPGWDAFCWKCHESDNLIPCSKCVRSFHMRCIRISKYDNRLNAGTWYCNECSSRDNAVSYLKRTRRPELKVELLSQLLGYALLRIEDEKKELTLSYGELPNIEKYLVNPVTYETLRKKLERKEFRSTEEFVSECRWIVHNVAICKPMDVNNKDISNAKTVFKRCRIESNEIDACPECYLNANTRKDKWFVDVCCPPHILLWAKLKGFPFWPAKVMGPPQGTIINVRFFGDHDRANVPLKDCFLYSEQHPNSQSFKRNARELADCIKEIDVHIENIRAKIGSFRYAKFKTQYDPNNELQQLEILIPGVTDYINRHLSSTLPIKPSLQYKIVKTADNNLSIIKKAGELAETEEAVTATKAIEPLEQNKNNILASKYEVICKTSADNSPNGEKVNAVIIKRKSITNEDETDSQKNGAAVDTNKKKRKEANLLEDPTKTTAITSKVRVKTCHKEQRLPVLSIKAKNSETKKAPKTQVQIAHSLVENLVKKKQGVTITKITKEVLKPSLEGSPVKKVSVKDTNANRANDIISDIVKTLKPFVEVKPEPRSGDDDKLSKVNVNSLFKTQKAEIKLPTINESETVINIITPQNSIIFPESFQLNELNGQKPQASHKPILIKEELFSDEEYEQNKNENVIHNCDIDMNSSINSCYLTEQSEEDLTSEKSVTSKTKPQRQNPRILQRARKSFPSKESLGEVKAMDNNIQLSSMVSIPADYIIGQMGASDITTPIPALPLRAASKNLVGSTNTITTPTATATPPANTKKLTKSSTKNVQRNKLDEIQSPRTPIVSSQSKAASKTPDSIKSTPSQKSNTANHETDASFLSSSSSTISGGEPLTSKIASSTLNPIITEPVSRGLPRLAPRPVPSPDVTSTPNFQAGPVSSTFGEKSKKFTEFFFSVMENTLSEISSGKNLTNLQATYALLQMELERTKSRHEQEISELKRAQDELKRTMEAENTRFSNELRKIEIEKQRAIEETKKKQWCANCGREAQFYCCWNTSYCDYPCQQLHWSRHGKFCAQASKIMQDSQSTTILSSTVSISNVQQKIPMQEINSSTSYAVIEPVNNWHLNNAIPQISLSTYNATLQKQQPPQQQNEQQRIYAEKAIIGTNSTNTASCPATFSVKPASSSTT